MAWSLDNSRATLASNDLTATFKLSDPRSGLREVEFAGLPLKELRPLQVTPSPPVGKETIIDAYVRGSDLVVTYAQLPKRTVRPQLAFRDLAGELSDHGAAGAELVVAVQTSLLSSDPTFSFLTEVNSKEIYGLHRDNAEWEPVDTSNEREIESDRYSGAFVFRLADCDFSYAELIFPTDFQGARLKGGNRATFSYEFFPDFFLEKGVIRKGRVWALLLPQANDLEIAAKCFQAMQASPPPLTV